MAKITFKRLLCFALVLLMLSLAACSESANAKEGLVIACGKGAVRVLELQAPGGKRMKSEDYLRYGYHTTR